jgi:diguanylate cyclase (GGDEF)-like protein/PAS domain S-box-containing protein
MRPAMARLRDRAIGGLGRRRAKPASAESRLLEAEAKYRTLVEQLPLVTYIDALTASATALYASPQVHSLLGYTVEEWLEDPEFFPKLLHPDDRRRVLDLVEHCNVTAEPFRSEYRLIARNGHTVWVQDESLVVCDENGRGLFTQGYLLDITDRKQAESRLAAEHGVARALAETASVGEAVQTVLAVMCGALGWESGAFWLLDRHDDGLRSLARWTASGTHRSGDGLAVQVCASLAPIWRPDSVAQTGAYALPVLLGTRLLGVLEFAGRELAVPDPGIESMLVVVASQLAQFVERQENEEAVAESEARKRAILDSALDCIITLDHRGRIIEFNPAAERTFGRGLDEVRGAQMEQLLVPPRLREDHRRRLAGYLEGPGGATLGSRIETDAMRADGTEFPIELTMARVDMPGPPLVTAYARDITERRRAEDRQRQAEEMLLHQALHDPLTDLPNRRLFFDRVGQALSSGARDGAPLAVLLMDLDGFKAINDTVGHDCGDRLLRELAERLRSCLRASDTVARLGGDEFGFVLRDVSACDALELTERIQLVFAEPFELREITLPMEASIGIALFPEHGDTADLLLRHADVAMYDAKLTGASHTVYDPSRDQQTLTEPGG